jgi:hypothetical protein
VLLIFNDRDPLQLFGTENHDFEHAMYGELTLTIEGDSGKIVDRFHGQNKSFQKRKNTSFSAVASENPVQLTRDHRRIRT